MYINGLIQKLEQIGNGLCIYGINMSSPTVADDMVLVSLSKKGMDNLLDICWKFSTKWRYLYNNQKCTVVFSNMQFIFNDRDISFFLGALKLNIVDSYTHLGIPLNGHLSTKEDMHDACIKLRG